MIFEEGLLDGLLSAQDLEQLRAGTALPKSHRDAAGRWRRVLAEMGRVLKPGGRLGITDVVAEDRLAAEERAERGSYVGCIAGALSRAEYVNGLEAVGFTDVSVEFTHEVADGMHGAVVKAVSS